MADGNKYIIKYNPDSIKPIKLNLSDEHKIQMDAYSEWLKLHPEYLKRFAELENMLNKMFSPDFTETDSAP